MEDSHHAGADDQRRSHNVEHALEVLWDLRRREMSGEQVGLSEDFLDRYEIKPGNAPPPRLSWPVACGPAVSTPDGPWDPIRRS